MSYKSGTVEKYKTLQSSLEQLQSNVAAELDQIRQDKLEIQALKNSIATMLDNGYYLRDNRRIILSAPEIVIGNVGRDGVLMSGGSKITLRAQDINLEGVGADDSTVGSVSTRASVISNIAVDPGIDGCESVVKSNSSIFNMARSVVMQSERAEDMFLYPHGVGGDGVHIISDTNINVEAMDSCESRKSYLKDLTSSLEEEKSALASHCSELKSQISSEISALDNLVMFTITPLTLEQTIEIIENQDIIAAQEDFEDIARSINSTMGVYFEIASQLAEVNRQIKSLEAASKAVDSKSSSFKSNDTLNRINLNSEYVGVSSRDGDGNIRETPSSMFAVNARMVNISSYDKEYKLIKDSSINMLSQTIDINTSNPNVSDESAEYPAEGDVRILSKNITLESVDYKFADDKVEEDKLTDSGAITLRASSIKGDTTSTDGTNNGMVVINSKRVEVKSMDLDKESGKDKSMTKGGVMLLNSEKMYVGGVGSTTESDNSTLLQVVSKDLGLFGSTTLELQQGKAIVQLAGDNLSASGSATAIYGKTTMAADVTFKGKASGGSADFKGLDVSTIFKGPSISDGVGVVAGGSGGSLSAKLKQEEIAEAPASQSE